MKRTVATFHDARRRTMRPTTTTTTTEAPRAWRPGRHTADRAVMRSMDNVPYRRRDSFDADKLAAELAKMRAEDEDAAARAARGRAMEAEREEARRREVEVLQAKARNAERAMRRETETREATERELVVTKDMASRVSVSERLKRHAEREVLELTTALERARSELERVAADSERRVREEKEAHEKNAAELESALTAAKESGEALRAEVARLESEQSATRSAKQSVEEELMEAVSELEETRANLEKTSVEKERIDGDLDEATRELSRLQEELEETSGSLKASDRELRESRRKNEALAAAIQTAKGNGNAARDLMRDSVMTLTRLEDAANAREVQILKERHAAEIARLQEEFAEALAEQKAKTGAFAHVTVDESQRVKRAMREVEEDAREAVRNARRKEEEAKATASKLSDELRTTKARLQKMIEAGEGKLNQASIRDAQAARLAASQAQAICRDLQAELEAEQESAEAARHEASETMHKFFEIRDKYEQREALVIHQKETIQALKRDVERRDGEIEELRAQCKELKLCLRDNEMTYMTRHDLTEEVEHLNRIIADANVRDRERSIELQREQERAKSYAEKLEQCEAQLSEESHKRIQLEHAVRDADSSHQRAEEDSLRAESMSASTVLLEAEVLRLTRINEQAETRIEELECRVEQLISQADGLASSQNPNQSIRYLEKLRDEREIAEKDAEEAGRAVQNMKAALQFVVCARRQTRDKVVQYAREARKTGRVFTEAPGLPTGVSAPIWGRIVETVARLNLDAVE